jgi:hypothetical protein
MAITRGAKRYQHKVTEEIKYFRNEPDLEMWNKVGTPGSKDWRWIHNANEERFVRKSDPVPEGFTLGRLKI